MSRRGTLVPGPHAYSVSRSATGAERPAAPPRACGCEGCERLLKTMLRLQFENGGASARAICDRCSAGSETGPRGHGVIAWQRHPGGGNGAAWQPARDRQDFAGHLCHTGHGRADFGAGRTRRRPAPAPEFGADNCTTGLRPARIPRLCRARNVEKVRFRSGRRRLSRCRNRLGMLALGRMCRSRSARPVWSQGSAARAGGPRRRESETG